MAKPGPKRKSDHLKIISGTDQPCRMSPPESNKPDIPSASDREVVRPTWVTGAIRKVWEKKLAEFNRRGQDVAGYEDALAQYCALEADLIDHRKKKRPVPVAMINAHRAYAGEFFDTSASNAGGTRGKRKNGFSNNGRKPGS